MSDQDLLTRYYVAQAGSGMGDFYSGPIYQKGYGIGSYLGGLFRSVLPILKRGGMALGKEILHSGSKFINDVENNVNPRAAFNTRVSESLQNLKRKAMYGEGYNAAKCSKKRQLRITSQSANKRRKIVKRKKKRRQLSRKKKEKLQKRNQH